MKLWKHRYQVRQDIGLYGWYVRDTVEDYTVAFWFASEKEATAWVEKHVNSELEEEFENEMLDK